MYVCVTLIRPDDDTGRRKDFGYHTAQPTSPRTLAPRHTTLSCASRYFCPARSYTQCTRRSNRLIAFRRHITLLESPSYSAHIYPSGDQRTHSKHVPPLSISLVLLVSCVLLSCVLLIIHTHSHTHTHPTQSQAYQQQPHKPRRHTESFKATVSDLKNPHTVHTHRVTFS